MEEFITVRRDDVRAAVEHDPNIDDYVAGEPGDFGWVVRLREALDG